MYWVVVQEDEVEPVQLLARQSDVIDLFHLASSGAFQIISVSSLDYTEARKFIGDIKNKICPKNLELGEV